MPRQREFDREVVLERAMNHFWEHGYEAASLSDLLGAMQIGRQSMYNTFGDKRSLFLTSLEHYAALGIQSMLEPLRSPDGGMKAIERYFAEGVVNMSAEPRRACFVVNCSVEVAPHDPEVAAITNRFVGELQGAFSTALSVAVRDGDADVQDIDGAGWRLTNAALGLAALSKLGRPAEALETVVDQLLETIRA